MARRRLDGEVVRRRLASSRAEALEAIRRGLVTVSGRVAVKPSTLVAEDEPVRLAAPARSFVSRGGEKLAAALDRFRVDAARRDCLDAGAATGGFTDCLLQRGAARVLAVDVGYGQLAWRLRNDPRVILLERTNVRELVAEHLPFRPTLVVADLSFISLRLALPPLAEVALPESDFVVLVKPQFEAGPADVGKGGVVRDPEVRLRVIREVGSACDALGLALRAAMASPLLGPAGNVEFFLHAVSGGEGAPLDLDALAAEAELVGRAS